MRIHPRLEAGINILLCGIGGDAIDVHFFSGVLRLADYISDGFRALQPIQNRHVHIHKYDIKALHLIHDKLLKLFKRLLAIVGYIQFQVLDLSQDQLKVLDVERVIIHNQDPSHGLKLILQHIDQFLRHQAIVECDLFFLDTCTLIHPALDQQILIQQKGEAGSLFLRGGTVNG